MWAIGNSDPPALCAQQLRGTVSPSSEARPTLSFVFDKFQTSPFSPGLLQPHLQMLPAPSDFLPADLCIEPGGSS